MKSNTGLAILLASVAIECAAIFGLSSYAFKETFQDCKERKQVIVQNKKHLKGIVKSVDEEPTSAVYFMGHRIPPESQIEYLRIRDEKGKLYNLVHRGATNLKKGDRVNIEYYNREDALRVFGASYMKNVEGLVTNYKLRKWLSSKPILKNAKKTKKNPNFWKW